MIRINDTYGVEVDANNYTLIRLSISQKGKSAGKERQTTMGHYSSLDNALYAAMREIQRDTFMERDMTLSEAVSEIRKIHADCKRIFRELTS